MPRSAQRILGQLSVVDVGSNAIPARRAVVVVDQDRPDQKPSIRAIRAPHARLGVEWLARLHRAPACREEPRQIVGMDDVGDLPLLRIVGAGAVVLASGTVEQFGLP